MFGVFTLNVFMLRGGVPRRRLSMCVHADSNKHASSLPRCSVSSAEKFYDTVPGLEQI
jgi:hypothetical protein